MLFMMTFDEWYMSDLSLTHFVSHLLSSLFSAALPRLCLLPLHSCCTISLIVLHQTCDHGAEVGADDMDVEVEKKNNPELQGRFSCLPKTIVDPSFHRSGPPENDRCFGSEVLGGFQRLQWLGNESFQSRPLDFQIWEGYRGNVDTYIYIYYIIIYIYIYILYIYIYIHIIHIYIYIYINCIYICPHIWHASGCVTCSTPFAFSISMSCERSFQYVSTSFHAFETYTCPQTHPAWLLDRCQTGRYQEIQSLWTVQSAKVSLNASYYVGWTFTLRALTYTADIITF